MKNKLKLITAFLLLTAYAWAQDKEQTEKEKEINAYIESTYKKVDAELQKKPDLSKQLKAELEVISKIKDTKELKLAMDNYEKKYSVEYGKVVALARLNIKNLVTELNVKYTEYEFATVNGYSISYRGRLSTGTTNSGTLHSLPSTTTVTVTDFQQSKEAGCQLLGFGDVDFTSKSVKAWTVGTVAGACTSTGKLSHLENLPANAKSIILKVKGKTEAEGYAVGVLGISFTSSSGGISYNYYNNDRPNFGEGLGSTYISLVAPYLWVANDRKSAELNIEKDITNFKGKLVEVILNSYSTSLSALCCSTSSFGKSSYDKIEIVISK